MNPTSLRPQEQLKLQEKEREGGPRTEDDLTSLLDIVSSTLLRQLSSSTQLALQSVRMTEAT